jgi:GNAT superfamily N-acetyltransferase
LTTKELTVRQAVSSDINRLMAFDHGYSTDHVWQLSYSRDGEGIGVVFREVRLPRPMQVTYPRNPENLADEWTHPPALLLADVRERAVAYLSIMDGPAQNSGWVTDLVVDVPYRRMGVGTRLLNAAIDWCRKRSHERVFIEMQSKNFPAIQMAQKSGFTFAGFSDRYYQDQDIVLFFTHELR